MTDSHVTEPIALARRARHRKPNRRRNVIKATLGSLAAAAAIGGTMAAASAQPGAQTFYGLTGTQAQTVTHHQPACRTEDSADCYAPSLPWHTVLHVCHVGHNCQATDPDFYRDNGIPMSRLSVTVYPDRDTAVVYVQDFPGTEVYSS